MPEHNGSSLLESCVDCRWLPEPLVEALARAEADEPGAAERFIERYHAAGHNLREMQQ